jgi:hypothetical protein
MNYNTVGNVCLISLSNIVARTICSELIVKLTVDCGRFN